ncbi:hypothetical protein [Klebsiella quasipneumoniae]
MEQDPSIKITNSTLRPFNFRADTSLSGICCGCLGSVRRRKWPMAAEG